MKRRARKAVLAPTIKPLMVLAKKLPLGEIPEGLDPTRFETYKSGFCCPSCGSLDSSSHSYQCIGSAQAKEAGVSLIEYAKDPSLWCPVVSGYEEEQVRCIKGGRPKHDGLHAFPTSKTCLESQRILGAVSSAEKEKLKPKVRYNPQEETEMAKAEKTNGKTKGKAAKGGNPAALKKAQEANEGKRAELHAKKIHLLTKDNPKREGTSAHKRFELYKNGMTVGEALEKGITMSDIRYNEEHGHLELK